MTMTVRRGVPGEARYYDVKQVAAILGVSQMTVYRAIHDGQIHAIRVRRRWLIPVRAIDDLATAQADEAC